MLENRLAMKPLEAIRQCLIDDGATRFLWHQFEGWEVCVDGYDIKLVLPNEPAMGGPWFWRPEFFGAFSDVDQALIARGWTSAFLDLPNHYGCPAAMDCYLALHEYACSRLALADRVSIVALSRAGLSAYRFASTYPDRVCAMYLDNPVCDFNSWPAGFGTGPGSPEDWTMLLERYHLTESEARTYPHQPWAILEPMVRAEIPVLHVCGDSDEMVPYKENSALVKEKFGNLGGSYHEIIIPGRRHHPHGLPDPTPIVKFLETHFERRFGQSYGSKPSKPSQSRATAEH